MLVLHLSCTLPSIRTFKSTKIGMLSKNYILHTAQLGQKSNYFKYIRSVTAVLMAVPTPSLYLPLNAQTHTRAPFQNMLICSEQAVPAACPASYHIWHSSIPPRGYFLEAYLFTRVNYYHPLFCTRTAAS